MTDVWLCAVRVEAHGAESLSAHGERLGTTTCSALVGFAVVTGVIAWFLPPYAFKVKTFSPCPQGVCERGFWKRIVTMCERICT
ncbi:unnamed protein product [Lathyrus oleraceus]